MTLIRSLTGRRWVGVGAAVWAVVLLVAATYAARSGRPTVREQTTIVEALPVLDRALAAVAQAAPGDRAVVGLGGYERTDGSCTAGNRDGVRYRRTATVWTDPGGETVLLATVRAALPAAYEARIRAGALRADAGFYVRLTGTVDSAGEVRFVADTDCRVAGGEIPDPPSGPVDMPLPAVDALLGRLGVTASRSIPYRMRCPSGGELSAISASAPRPAGPMAAALPAGVTPIVARPDAVVYRAGEVGLVARLRDGEVLVTAATSCQ